MSTPMRAHKFSIVQKYLGLYTSPCITPMYLSRLNLIFSVKKKHIDYLTRLIAIKLVNILYNGPASTRKPNILSV